jgi:hypothetical protein
MKYKIKEQTQFDNNKATIYSVIVDNEQQTLFQKFLIENMVAFRPQVANIYTTIKTIANETGAQVHFFTEGEGNLGDGICALKDQPNSNLRLYCIRLGNGIVILGGGGEKPKNIRKLQDNEKLTNENYLLRTICKDLTNRITNREITYIDDGQRLDGNLEFEID